MDSHSKMLESRERARIRHGLTRKKSWLATGSRFTAKKKYPLDAKRKTAMMQTEVLSPEYRKRGNNKQTLREAVDKSANRNFLSSSFVFFCSMNHDHGHLGSWIKFHQSRMTSRRSVRDREIVPSFMSVCFTVKTDCCLTMMSWWPSGVQLNYFGCDHSLQGIGTIRQGYFLAFKIF